MNKTSINQKKEAYTAPMARIFQLAAKCRIMSASNPTYTETDDGYDEMD